MDFLLICGLVNNEINISDHSVLSNKMISELERIRKGVIVDYLRHYLGICLQELRKTTKKKNTCQDSSCHGEVHTQVLPRYT
jgi:hypothetical protein